jgi:hypothetical protein
VLSVRHHDEDLSDLTWCLRAGVIRQQVIEHLMRQIMHYDAKFRREEATSRTTLLIGFPNSAN